MKNIVLVGPMGAGKTTIGKLVAQKLGHLFVDSDHEIIRRTGVDIPTIFDYEGEKGFRVRESSVLQDLIMKKSIVLATGGGAVLTESNRRMLNDHGYICFLSVSIENQIKRVSKDRNRPLLQVPDLTGTLKKMSDIRTPLYQNLADIKIDTDKYKVSDIAQHIIHAYRQTIPHQNKTHRR